MAFPPPLPDVDGTAAEASPGTLDSAIRLARGCGVLFDHGGGAADVRFAGDPAGDGSIDFRAARTAAEGEGLLVDYDYDDASLGALDHPVRYRDRDC